MISFLDDELVLGRGRVFFDPFLAGTRTTQGERYVGNTLSFQVVREVRRQERMISVGGRKFADTGAIVEESHKVTFVTDNIDVANLADFFGQSSSVYALAAGTVTETLTVRRGRSYQLGKALSPVGVRHILFISVKMNGLNVADDQWQGDTVAGRIYIPPTSSIPDGATITVEWDRRDQQLDLVSSSPVELWGALRFVSDNAVGGQKYVLLPCVRLFARGAIDLKGDQWQQLPFEAEATNLTPAISQIYLDLVDTDPGQTVDEKWLSANPVSGFTALEDQFDTGLNQILPGIFAPVIPVYTYTLGGSEIPADAGMSLTGAYDLLVDGVKVYRGLNAPFIRPDVDATTIVAYPSILSATQDFVLSSNGVRIALATDSLVLKDDDIWSIRT